MIPVFAHQPHYRIVLAVDVEGSTTRTNSAKARLRDAMYEVLVRALLASGIGPHLHDPLIDRGDGILVLIHPADQVPKTVVLGSVVPLLAHLLALHNAHRGAEALRLRVVVHAGEVHYDRRGPFGEALDVAFRLLDAAESKLALRRTAAPLVLVISGELYVSVVRHGYAGIDPRSFVPLGALRVASVWRAGWLHVPALLPYGPRVWAARAARAELPGGLRAG